MFNAANLSNSIEALKAELLARDAALLASEAKVAHLNAELSTRTAEAWLRNVLPHVAPPVNRVDDLLRWNCADKLEGSEL